MYGSVMLEFLVLAHRHCERSAANQLCALSSMHYHGLVPQVMAPNPKAQLLKTIVLK